MNSRDEIQLACESLLNDDDLKGLKNFFINPIKVRFEHAGVSIKGHETVTPIFNIYNNEVRLGILIKNGSTHNMLRTLNMVTRHKYFSDKNPVRIGEELFNIMMTDGFTFHDKINDIEVSVDFKMYDKPYIIGTTRVGNESFVTYGAYYLKEFLVTIFKYKSDRFKEYILSEDSRNLFDVLDSNTSDE